MQTQGEAWPDDGAADLGAGAIERVGDLEVLVVVGAV